MVDAKLAVHGIAGLRVADASVMPVIVSGNTNAPAIMIGEKAAEFILELADEAARTSSEGNFRHDRRASDLHLPSRHGGRLAQRSMKRRASPSRSAISAASSGSTSRRSAGCIGSS